MRKYNFNDYWRENPTTLRIAKQTIADEIKYIQDNYVIHNSKNNNIATPSIAKDDYDKYRAELKFINRVLLIRRFWYPIGWYRKVAHYICSLERRISYLFDNLRLQREYHISKEKRISYYRKQVQEIEKKLLKMFPEVSSDCSWTGAEKICDRNISKSREDKAKLLLIDRSYYLDQMFQSTNVEIKRLEVINDGLRSFAQFLKKCACEFNGKDSELTKGDAWDNDNESNLVWAPEFDDEGSILSYDGDCFYGSDFKHIIMIEKMLFNNDLLDSCECISCSNEKDKNGKNKVIIRGDFYDDELSDWKEGIWRRPEFEHIQVCHALHHLFDHLNLPIVDILHINSFRLEFRRENSIYLDIIETSHPTGFGKYHRREEYKKQYKFLKNNF